MPSKPTVYIETSVISYFAAKPSADLLSLAKQHLTTMWWERTLPKVNAHISPFVLEELKAGDQEAANERMQVCKMFPVLDETPEITPLSRAYLVEMKLPERAEADAFHIACATVYQMNFLLTWNCSHIANAFVRRKIEDINLRKGYETPVICTPEELLEI
ncbi:MAG TPA: type II toxin-antitoxin system VapC family toxin [Bdellovibrionota bacterium]|nr:type II toxin-antitoxin system VapC family toxin [Bdellovibrionota bacterium]